MTTHTIRKGHDLKIKGLPAPELGQLPEPVLVGLEPREFLGAKPKLLVKEGERVRTGQPLLLDKTRDGLHFVAPATGKVSRIALGARRFPERVEITPAEADDWFDGPRVDPQQLDSVPREEIVAALRGCGLWASIRQRPLGKIADPAKPPVAIYVNGLDTEPLAADPAFAVKGRGEALQLGIDLLRRLTDGPVRLTVRAGGAVADEFRNLRGVETHEFGGPHPAGLVGTHIAAIQPLRGAEVVWYLKAQEVAALGDWLATGHLPTHKVVALSGSAAPTRQYYRVRSGAALFTLTGGKPLGGDVRLINGTVLSGMQSPPDGFLQFYSWTVTAIPEGKGRRDLFGWALPGFGRYSASRAVASWWTGKDRYEMDAQKNGGPRNIVNIGAWERMTPLDIHPTYLVRAIQAGDLEEAIALGLLEVTEEDVALCTFADPCKIEVGEIIRQGLDLYEKEG